ncbi:MAG: tail fiber domain-containing protein [Thermoanaerobaculia bacterium]
MNLSGDLSLTGNVKLPATSGSGNGVIMFGTKQGLHEFGTTNVFVGPGSGNFTLTGAGNVGVGFDTLLSLTTGLNNVAAGPSAVQRVTAGSNNVGFGSGALSFVTTGSNNVAIGPNALNSMDSGSSNIAIGASAGLFLASNANGNIDIDNAGTNTDGATIRIGTGQTRTFLAGVRGITTGNANAIAVVVDSAGQLGTVSSSRRFKQDIKPMGNRTDALMRLNPVTFRYKSQAADSRLQYGLIAEDVDEVYPDLVVHDDAGRPETVMYQFLAPMLLNKVQEQQRTIDDLSARLRVLEAMMNAQEQAP